MSERGKTPALTCTADGFVYEISADERNLYFNKIGREGSQTDGHTFGCMRVVKAEVEAVRCMRVRGQTVILVVFEGKTSRLVVKGAVRESLLMEIFDGVPLKMSIHGRSDVRSERYELRLLSAAFGVMLLRVLCAVVPELEPVGPYLLLGWIAIPFLWMVPSANRMAPSGLKAQFHIGAGMAAAAFSCIFLWAASLQGVENWSAVLLPSLVGAVVVGGVYLLSRHRLEWKAALIVALVALLAYAPAAVLCLNRLLPPLRVETSEAEVVELTSEYNRGDYNYYAIVDLNGVESYYEISREEYSQLVPGSTVSIERATGLLGIVTTGVKCE